MTDLGLQSMADDPHLLSKRLARFVQPIPAKSLARSIGCDVRTAENIRAGHWPIARHWLGLVLAYGTNLTDAVFHPERAAARIEKELRDLEAALAEKQKALRDAQGLAPCDARHNRRDQARSAVVIAPDFGGPPP